MTYTKAAANWIFMIFIVFGGIITQHWFFFLLFIIVSAFIGFAFLQEGYSPTRHDYKPTQGNPNVDLFKGDKNV